MRGSTRRSRWRRGARREPIGRGQAGALPGQHEAGLREHATEGGRFERGAKTGDRLQLVEGASGVAERAPGHHRDVEAGGRAEGGQAEGDLVAHAAGRVLVDRTPGERRPLQPLAGVDHRPGPGPELAGAEAAPDDRHQQGRQLIVGDRAAHGASDHRLDLAVGRARLRRASWRSGRERRAAPTSSSGAVSCADRVEEARAAGDRRNAERGGDRLTEIAERGSRPERRRPHAGTESEQRDALARVVGAGPGRIVAMVSGDEGDVTGPERLLEGW